MTFTSRKRVSCKHGISVWIRRQWGFIMKFFIFLSLYPTGPRVFSGPLVSRNSDVRAANREVRPHWDLIKASFGFDRTQRIWKYSNGFYLLPFVFRLYVPLRDQKKPVSTIFIRGNRKWNYLEDRCVRVRFHLEIYDIINNSRSECQWNSVSEPMRCCEEYEE